MYHLDDDTNSSESNTSDRSIRLAARRHLPAPAQAVWEVIAAYERDPEWRTGVTSMTPDPPGPLAPGSVTVEVMRFGGRTYRNVGEILEVLPGRSVAWRTTAGAEASGRRSVEPRADGSCDVALELTVRPRGIERLLAPVLSRMLARNLDRDLADLERLVLASRVPAVATGGSPI